MYCEIYYIVVYFNVYNKPDNGCGYRLLRGIETMHSLVNKPNIYNDLVAF